MYDTAVFEIVGTSDKGKRLVLKSDAQYCTITLAQQKCVDVIPDYEPEFDLDANVVLMDDDDQYQGGRVNKIYEYENSNPLNSITREL